MYFSSVACPRTAAILTEKHGSLKTLKQRCWFCLHKQRPVAVLKSALEFYRNNLYGTVLRGSRGNTAKIRAQEVIVNTFKNLLVVFCLKNLYHHGAIKVVCLNLVPCCAA